MINCPFCRKAEMQKLDYTDGTYECPNCGEKTHEKVEQNKQELKEVRQTDLPVAQVAE